MLWTRRRLLAAAAAASSRRALAADALTVGGKNFTEQLLMAEITAQMLRGRGVPVAKQTGLTTAALRRAQEAGEVDLCWEYTGTSLANFNGVAERLGPRESLNRVRELDGRRGLVWLDPSRVNNTYALAMRRAEAESRGIASLSGLAREIGRGRELRLGVNSEFFSRPDGFRPLARTYGFDPAAVRVVRIGTSLIYHALRDRQVDVGLVFATDGRIAAYGFSTLADDRAFFPDYTMAPVVRAGTLDRNPSVREPLALLSGRLDSETMARLNAGVDVDRLSVEEVSARFLSGLPPA